jgi:hypothetical protein
VEPRGGYEGRELFDQFTIAHDYVGRTVTPRRFHPIRQSVAGKTFQALYDQRRPQHIATQILQFFPLMRWQADIGMDTESIDIRTAPDGWFRFLGFSAASPGGDALASIRTGCDSPAHTTGIQAGQPRRVPHQRILVFRRARRADSFLG